MYYLDLKISKNLYSIAVAFLPQVQQLIAVGTTFLDS